ncbi:hypothetical protein AOC10_06275 [Polynucleobacter asymbioticus]|jgi:hypothetical protein|uniref:hypothetical protein n=1 Tax=Polynucleobacter asymbioticus TaxID=576611 RepID=UPI0008FB7244|nr:hypothetical protein [Polynucleobacter asymbioticus]APC06156.1 hypothetical protein AOC10_06275 [Polynucleobacter asymbioticus]MBT8582695.1 hypothetical protein [Polynucleobacter paneuropaeus]MBT8611890.1 hypothetical protein [Polynucleobacter paneuropaeus]
MTQVANEVEGFKSEVLTKGGSIQRVQDREAKKERERLEKEVYEKHAAESAARRNKAREERALELIAQAKARQEAAQLDKERSAQISAQIQQTQKAERKSQSRSQATNLLDDLSKTPNASLAKLSEDIDEGEVLEEESEALETESIFTPVKGEVHVPAFMSALESKLAAQVDVQAHDLSELLPAPVAITVDTLPKTEIQAETAQELMKRTLNPGPSDSSPDAEPSVNTETSGGIKSKRGCERIQKVINEKRDLEKQVIDLQSMVATLQDAVRKYEIESKLVSNVMTLADSQKKPSELVSEAKLQMLKFLNTRSDEIDHTDKAICFNKYMSDPFYMQVFVQSNQPEQWQTMIESIYEAIGRPEPSFASVKPMAIHSPQPIRARTSALGAPLASAGNPMDRIAQHLGNMGI